MKIVDAKVVMSVNIKKFNEGLTEAIKEFNDKGYEVKLQDFNTNSARIGGNSSNTTEVHKYVMVVAYAETTLYTDKGPAYE